MQAIASVPHTCVISVVLPHLSAEVSDIGDDAKCGECFNKLLIQCQLVACDDGFQCSHKCIYKRDEKYHFSTAIYSSC